MNSLFHLSLAIVFAPLILGIINRTKAWIAGRTGQPMLQAYSDLLRLFRKGAVYSHTTSWVFRTSPLIGLACMIGVLIILPLGAAPASVAFPGDMILAAYLMGLARFLTVSAALDTGSAFEGMGASREVQFSVLAEPSLLTALAALGLSGVYPTKEGGATASAFRSLSDIFQHLSVSAWAQDATVLLLIVSACFIVMLTENCRIPVDDPTTHLELTMIHEVMVLDHSGPDFGMILLTASLKLWAFLALLAGILVPVRTGILWIDVPAILMGMGMLAVGIGIVESVMARLRLIRVPQLLMTSLVLSVLALVLVIWG